AVTINGAADKLHFERVKSFAVADGCQRVGMHRLAGDAGGNLPLFRRRSAPQTEQCDDNKRSAALHGVLRVIVEAASSSVPKLHRARAGSPRWHLASPLRA